MSTAGPSPSENSTHRSDIQSEMQTYRVLANISRSDWAIHFIGSDGKTRIGPWLLFDSHEEILEILRWDDITTDELAEHESSLRRWYFSSVALYLTEAKYKALIQRGRGWPWNGYKLLRMKAAGRYPPERLKATTPNN